MAQGISIPVVQSGLEASIQQGARNVGSINIQASVDPSSFKNLAQPLGRVSGLATEFEKSIAASNARVLAFGASVGIINGVQNAFSALVTTGIEVQKTLADIAAVSGKSGQELSKFGDQLFEVGKMTGQSFQTAAQAALEFSRQGLSAEETLKRTSDALTLTRFTSLKASEAVDVLTAAANSFSETGITTAQIINKLIAVDTKFAVSAEDLANGLARAGSIAQEVGVNFDQLNAAITVAQERTARGGAVIGNALKTIFTRVRSDETVKSLQEIGIFSRDAEGNLKPALQLLSELAGRIDQFGGQKKIELLEAVASKYNINILSALLKDLQGANSKFAQVVQVSSGASNEAYVRQIELNKTLSAEINKASVSATQLLNKLAEIGVTESLTNLLKFVNNLVEGFTNLLDSESIGGDIARSLIKGLSGVFFNVGLPILAAIFIKLTTDIAKFGVESLKTILGINQQVRERQALEQAVVNTLIQDREVMASILALSGNRAKQEEYLLGVFNRQLTALQQVQNIASSVTPALMAGGLSATSGQIKKRGAGGYLPSQEAADVRRGVGGASASSRVVSIPNFAFGGGKRGTMIANTSEYIVPNFANGGSAIFNQDMARAYGLPAGAKKISAAGGYVPNFAQTINANEEYVALVGQKLESGKSLVSQNETRYIVPGKGKDYSIARTGNSNQDKILFNVFGVPEKSATGSTLEETKAALEDTGKNLAIKTAMAVTGGAMPKPEELAKTNAKFNPGSLSAFAGSIFEASVGAILGDKTFEDVSAQAVTSRFDFDLAQNSPIKTAFGIKNPNSRFLEVKGSYNPSLMDGVARKIYDVAVLGEAATSTVKIGQSEGKGMGIKRPYSDLKNLTVEEGPEGNRTATKFKTLGQLEEYVKNKYSSNFGSSVVAGSQKFREDLWPKRGPRSALGYIPNFAQDPLRDAIQREMDAGLDPSQIRVTQDGRLRNSGNPNGLAVINTRDEPNGKIPNFAEDDVTQKGDHYFIEKNGRLVPISKAQAAPLKAKQEEAMLNYTPASATGGAPASATGGAPASATGGAPASATGGKKAGKELDIGKFLLFQTAISGATSAASSFAEQGSTAANVIETIGGVGQAASGALLTIGTNLNPWAKGISIGITAIAALTPIVMKFAGSFETATDRTSKALAKLAEEAEKTGRAVTPEQFLAAFETEQKKTEQKTRADSSQKQIEASLRTVSGSGMLGGLTDTDIKPIIAALSAAGQINAKGEVDKQALENILSSSVKTRDKYVAGQGGNVTKVSEKYLDQGAALQAGKDLVLQNQAKSLTNVEQVAKSDIALKAENDILDLGLKIRGNIFDAEMQIGKAQAKRALDSDKEIALLERKKGILTEQAYAQEQYSLEVKKAARERAGARESTGVDLMKSLQGVTDSKLGNVLGQLGQNQTSSILSQFQNGGYNTQEFRDVFKKETGVDFNALAKESRDSVVKSLETATQADKSTGEKFNQAQAAAAQKLSLFQTETQKINQNIAYLNEELSGTTLGQAKYTERLDSAIAKLAETEAQQAVNNKLELDMARAKFDSDMKMLDTQIAHEEAIRKTIPIGQRAAKFAKELEKSTSEKIDQIMKEALASEGKYYADLNLTAAENQAYETYLNLISVTDEVISENEKQILVSAKARRSAEVLAARQGEIFNEESKALEDKILIAKAFNKQVGIVQLTNKVQLELALEQENLIRSSRELSARQLKMAGELSNNQEKTRQGAAGELLGIMTSGNIGRAGFAGDTRLAEVVKQRTGGNVNRPIGEIDAVKREMTVGERMYIEAGKLQDQAQTFQQIIGDQTPKMFADGMAQAMEAALNQSENLGQALNGIAMGFLKTLQGAFLQSASNQIVASLIPKPFAQGGVVTGGSGYRDDVPAMLTGGEFVMRKSAVQKYGTSNLERMNNGGMFIPGTRGGGAISGDDALRAFANQSTTSGATDALKGSRSSAFINLEDESQKLSRYALLGDDTINQEVRGAKMQAFDILKNKSDFEKQQKEAEKQQKKALVRQMIGTVAAGALSYGVGKIAGPKIAGAGAAGGAPKLDLMSQAAGKTQFLSGAEAFKMPGQAYGGMIRRYASGGPTDDIPAMLMSGEYVMNRGASRKYGKQFLDSMNQGRAPRFADGGEVTPSAPTTTTESNAKMMGDVNISINVTGQNSQSETQGSSNQGGVDYKKMSERIKSVVLETLNEEKRLGGSLRSR